MRRDLAEVAELLAFRLTEHTVAVNDALTELETLDLDELPLPLRQVLGSVHEQLAPFAGPVCRVCGCREDDACEGGCAWVEGDDLCTACADDDDDLRVIEPKREVGGHGK